METYECQTIIKPGLGGHPGASLYRARRSQSYDVKAAGMNSGDILVHSNESCGGGPGGFEIYNVDDPEDPVHQASAPIATVD